MSVLETHSCQSSYRRLQYVFNELPHNTKNTKQRVLCCSGQNIRMLHDSNGQLSNVQSGYYLEKQYQKVLRRAHNPNRRYQVQSMIISFDPSEFDAEPEHLSVQAQQALKLAQNFVHKYFGDTQCVMAVQSDGDGGKLHIHILFNTVKPSGKTVATNRFNINKLRSQMDNIMEHDFQRITGRRWSNPIRNQEQRHDIDNLTNRSQWQRYLKKLINQIKGEANSIDEFIHKLSAHEVSVKGRAHGTAWTYSATIHTLKGNRILKVRDFYQRRDKLTGEIKSTRGLGRNFSKESLVKYFKLKQHVDSKKKEEITNGSRKKDEQLLKLKTMAADARARVRRQQRINTIQSKQFDATKAEEQKQKAQRNRQEAGRNHQYQGQHPSDRRIGRQTGYGKPRTVLSKAQRRHQPETGGPEF